MQGAERNKAYCSLSHKIEMQAASEPSACNHGFNTAAWQMVTMASFRRKASVTGASCPHLGLTAGEVASQLTVSPPLGTEYVKTQELLQYVKASEFATFAVQTPSPGTVPRRTATGSLIGNLDGVAAHANTAKRLYQHVRINNVQFDGETDVTISNIGTLTAGSHLTGDVYDGSGNTTLSVNAVVDAVASTVPLRTPEGTLRGDIEGTADHAMTAAALLPGCTINGVSFDGAQDITITTASTGRLSTGAHLLGADYNGSADITWTVDAHVEPHAGSLPLRTETGMLKGNIEGTAGALSSTATINGTVFDGTADITITDAALATRVSELENEQLLRQLQLLRVVWHEHIVPRLVLDGSSLVGVAGSSVIEWANTSGSGPATSDDASLVTVEEDGGVRFVRTQATYGSYLSLPSVTLNLLHGFTVTVMVRQYSGYAQYRRLFSFMNGTSFPGDFSNLLDVFTASDSQAGGLGVYDGFGGNMSDADKQAQLAFPGATEWLVFTMVRTNASWVFIRDGATFSSTTDSAGNAIPPAPFPVSEITWTKNALGAQALQAGREGNFDFAYFSLVEGAMTESMVHALHGHLKSRV